MISLKPLNDSASRDEVTVERKVQNMIGGGCSVPLGINAAIEDHVLTLRIAYGDEDRCPSYPGQGIGKPGHSG